MFVKLKLLQFEYISDEINAFVFFPVERIVGGKDASIRDFPFQMSLEVQQNHICGAIIVTEKRALTAAHCTFHAPSVMSVSYDFELLNQAKRKRIALRKYTKHPKFDEESLEYDIAVLFLKDSLVFNQKTVQPVTLPEESDTLLDGTLMQVSGWGVTRHLNMRPSNRLQYVEVPIVDRKKCSNSYNRVHKVTENMICAGFRFIGGKDSCQGDSGGPLTRRGVLYGIVSFGHGCALPKYPGVYTNVAALRSWIDKTIR